MTNSHNGQEEEIGEAWKRLRENQSRRSEKRIKDIKNVKTIFLFFLVIIVFILFYLVIKGFMQENISKSSDLIKIEIRDMEEFKGKKEK